MLLLVICMIATVLPSSPSIRLLQFCLACSHLHRFIGYILAMPDPTDGPGIYSTITHTASTKSAHPGTHTHTCLHQSRRSLVVETSIRILSTLSNELNYLFFFKF